LLRQFAPAIRAVKKSFCNKSRLVDGCAKLLPCYRKTLEAALVQIDIEYQGRLRCQAKHEPSGAVLITDAPKDNQGEGASFSPTDLVATGLGTCMLTIMGIVAQRDGIDIVGTTVRVIKEMEATPTRRIGKLTITIHVPQPLTPEQQQKLKNAANTCPVYKSLSPDVKKPVEFIWASGA
jgi:putative redox protein